VKIIAGTLNRLSGQDEPSQLKMCVEKSATQNLHL